jgi:hypothetical protein
MALSAGMLKRAWSSVRASAGQNPHSEKRTYQVLAKQESYSDRLTQVSAMANSE